MFIMVWVSRCEVICLTAISTRVGDLALVAALTLTFASAVPELRQSKRNLHLIDSNELFSCYLVIGHDSINEITGRMLDLRKIVLSTPQQFGLFQITIVFILCTCIFVLGTNCISGRKCEYRSQEVNVVFCGMYDLSTAQGRGRYAAFS